MQGQGIFDPDYYRQFRPYYPKATFAGILELLVEKGFAPPFSVLDVGCGTGHSSISLLDSGVNARITGVDPDPGMLAHATDLTMARGFGDRFQFMQGRAESLPVSNGFADLLLVGSAFHWMDPVRASLEFKRVLKPSALLHIFEYQFPKAVDQPQLDEWIRRRFNQDWKAPAQVPRGDFQSVTRVFRESKDWKRLLEGKPAMRLTLSSVELQGLILSQSRVFHYEATLQPQDKISFRADLASRLTDWMKDGAVEFDFKSTSVTFERRA